jgi:type I restriction enzyme S subunit
VPASEWNTVTLGDVLDRISRPVVLEPESEYTPLGVRWYCEGVFRKETQLGSKIAAKTLYSVEEGDVIYSRLFAWKGSFGVVEREHRDGVVSNEFPTYRATPALLPEFFAAWAARPSVWDLAGALSSGTTANSRFRLGEDSFLMLEIDLPPVEEQGRIVDAVAALDDLRVTAICEAAVCAAALAAGRDALIDEAAHPTVELGDVLEAIDAGKSPKIPDRRPTPDEWGVLKVSSIRPGRFIPAEAKALPADVEPFTASRIRKGDVLTVRGSGSRKLIGSVCKVKNDPGQLLLSDLVLRMTFDLRRVDTDYIVHALSTSAARAQIENETKGTTTLGKISRAILRALEVSLPDTDTQRDIARELDVLGDELVALERESRTAADLRAALIEALVSGERHIREDGQPIEVAVA